MNAADRSVRLCCGGMEHHTNERQFLNTIINKFRLVVLKPTSCLLKCVSTTTVKNKIQ